MKRLLFLFLFLFLITVSSVTAQWSIDLGGAVQDDDWNIELQPPAIGPVYGELWVHEEDNGVVPLSVGVYTNVSNNVTSNYTRGMTFASNNSLVVHYTGIYAAVTQLTFSGQANTEYHLTLGVNSVRQLKCHAERKIGTGGDVGSSSFVCLYKFFSGDVLTVMVENVDNNGDMTVHNMQLNVVKID